MRNSLGRHVLEKLEWVGRSVMHKVPLPPGTGTHKKSNLINKTKMKHYTSEIITNKLAMSPRLL